MSISWPAILASFQCPKRRSIRSISWPAVFPVPKAREHHEHQLAGCFSTAQSMGKSLLYHQLASPSCEFQCPKRGSIMSISWLTVFPVPKAREHHEHQLASHSCEFPVPQAQEHQEHQLAGCFSSAQSTGAS